MSGNHKISNNVSNNNGSITNTCIGEQVNTKNNNSNVFSVGGSVSGDINNVQGDNNHVVQGDSNQVGVDTKSSFTSDDIVKFLEYLEALVKTAELPEETKEEVIEDLGSAKKATNKDKPNKKRALERLEDATKTLENTSKAVDAGQKIWSKAKPIITKIAPWFGATAGSYLLKL